MKKLLLPALALFALILTACSPFSLVNSETYNDANLSDYNTFRIVSPADGELPPGMQMVTYYNIAAAIREQMIMRGYTESPTSPLLINIGLTVHRKSKPSRQYRRVTALMPDLIIMAIIPTSCIRDTIIGPITILMPESLQAYTKKAF